MKNSKFYFGQRVRMGTNKIFFMLFCLFMLMAFTGCNRGEKISAKITFYEFESGNGNITYVFWPSEDRQVFLSFDSVGALLYVGNRPCKDGAKQVIYYDPGTGFMESKVKFDVAGNKTGQELHFYPESGNLSAVYNYMAGVKTGSAVTYHDSTNFLKCFILYDYRGEMYYCDTFDVNEEALQMIIEPYRLEKLLQEARATGDLDSIY